MEILKLIRMLRQHQLIGKSWLSVNSDLAHCVRHYRNVLQTERLSLD